MSIVFITVGGGRGAWAPNEVIVLYYAENSEEFTYSKKINPEVLSLKVLSKGCSKFFEILWKTVKVFFFWKPLNKYNGNFSIILAVRVQFFSWTPRDILPSTEMLSSALSQGNIKWTIPI